jgi:type II secretory pathway pseudopilin PulG
MKLRLNLSIFFSIFISSILAQITEMSPMPERVTNNAVVEGFVDEVPYVYSFAGLDSTKEYSGIHLRSFRYNTQTDVWESIPPLPDTLGKIATAASRIGDIIYIIGGYHVFSNGSEISSNRVHRYDTQSNSYLSDGTPIPVPIDDQVQAVWRDSLIYVVTGWSNNQNVTNVQIYNPSTDEWIQGTPIPNEDSYPSFGAAGLIFNDTIYYFGGAKNNSNFSIQRHMRKGVINANDPTEISWSAFILDWGIKAYRPVAYKSFGNNLFWVGGSDNTYNYDGIAYNNGQGVEPSRRVLYLNRYDNSYQEYFYDSIPMDLRGIASIADTVHYLAGGMESGQLVSNKTLKLTGFPLTTNTLDLQSVNIKVNLFPNPVNQKLFLTIDEIQDCNNLILKIYDLKGIELKEIEIQNCEAEIDISDLPAGTYLLSVKNGERVLSKNIIKN